MAPPGVVSVKSPEAFRTISEVAAMLDVPQHVLRFWETRFSQIRPIKRAGGRRFYRPEDVDLLRGIRLLLYYEGYTIRGAQKILREKGVRYTASLGREQTKNGHAAAAAPEVITPAADGGALDVLATLKSIREDIVETLAPECDDAGIMAPPNVASENPPPATPRRVRLEELRGELLDLKSRLATARDIAST
ncbi:MAG TPA: MerR family transcriptional regulator [Rhizomicrobium sp.]|jgi:DNA-binding transcriptional MerR regulator|nr:MerR family transcriptional regulator [Rhizomicrobium sp.]